MLYVCRGCAPLPKGSNPLSTQEQLVCSVPMFRLDFKSAYINPIASASNSLLPYNSIAFNIQVQLPLYLDLLLPCSAS